MSIPTPAALYPDRATRTNSNSAKSVEDNEPCET